MTGLADVVALATTEHFLAVVSTVRADDTIQSSLVNAGVLPHPITGDPQLGYVTYGRTKLTNLRRRPQTSVSFRSGWRWLTVEGTSELIGPDDPRGDVDDDRLRQLLRDVFVAAGGTHDNWDEYDAAMRRERRTAVLVTPTRIYGN